MCQGLAEEGACDAYPPVRTAGAKQVRLEFRADAHAAISGASARTVLGYDPPPAAKRRARTARVDIAVGRRPPAACNPNPRKPAAAGSAYRRCCTTRPCIARRRVTLRGKAWSLDVRVPALLVQRDGSTVVIRPLASGDEAAIAAWFKGLGPETRYARFLAGVNRLNDRTRSELARVDHRDREVLTAVAADRAVVGIAR